MTMPPQRLARRADVEAIGVLVRSSIHALFAHFYDERQTASAAIHIGDPDVTLIDDGTYFVHEAGGDARLLDPATEPARIRAMFVRATGRGATIEACERDARAAGFSTMALMATLPGEL